MIINHRAPSGNPAPVRDAFSAATDRRLHVLVPVVPRVDAYVREQAPVEGAFDQFPELFRRRERDWNPTFSTLGH
jgi:hypothetical protein